MYHFGSSTRFPLIPNFIAIRIVIATCTQEVTPIKYEESSITPLLKTLLTQNFDQRKRWDGFKSFNIIIHSYMHNNSTIQHDYLIKYCYTDRICLEKVCTYEIFCIQEQH